MAEQQSFLIWPGGSDPGVSYGSLEMRRRIAQALASGKRPFPKTKGEGLTYLGESIGEGLQYLGLQRAEKERQQRLEKQAKEITDAKSSDGGTKTSYDQTDNKPFPVAASDEAYNTDRPTQVVQTPAEGASGPAVAFSDVAPMQTTAAWPDTPSFSDRYAAANVPPPEATPVQTVSAAPSFSDRYAAVSERPLQAMPQAARAAVSSPEQLNTFFTPQMQASMTGGNAATAADVAPPVDAVTLPTETADIPLPRGNPRTVGGTIATMEGTLARQGYAPNEIKGMIRNAYDESRFDWSPGSRHFDQPNFRGTEAAYSHGLFQEGGDEYNKMVAWRDKNYPGYSLDDPRLQTEYVGQRLQDPQYARTYAAMKGSDTPGQAADAFLRGYLKPAPQYQAQRSASYLRGDEPVYQQTAAVSRGGGGGGGGEAAGRVGGAPGDSRDAITEALLAQNQPQPQQAAQAPTQEEAVADNRLADVAGARRPGAPIFAPTAALGRAGIGTDAPMPGLSPMGSLGGGINQSIDARRNAISDALQNQQPTAPAVPPENPTQPGTSLSPTTASPWTSAATSALPNPPVISDIRPAPIGGPGVQVAQAAPAAAGPTVPAPTPQSTQPSQAGLITPYAEPIKPTPPQRLPRDAQELAAIRMKLANPGDPDAAQIADTILKDKEQRRNDIFLRDVEQYKSDLIRYNAEQAKYLEDKAGGFVKRVQDYAKEAQNLPTTPGVGAPGTPGAVPPGATPQGPDPRLGTPQSPQRNGIPAMPLRPPEIPPAEWAKQQAPLMTKAVEAVQTAAPQFEDAIKAIQLAREHPGLYAGTGATGHIARNIWGTNAYAFGKVNEQMQGKTFLAAYGTLKGGGPISNVEGDKAQIAQARLDPNQDPKSYHAALNELETQLRRDFEIAQRKAHLPVTAWQRTPNDPVAPDLGQQRVNKEGGYVEEYIGGNPADKQRSWKRVQ